MPVLVEYDTTKKASVSEENAKKLGLKNKEFAISLSNGILYDISEENKECGVFIAKRLLRSYIGGKTQKQNCSFL